ncbi:MAG: cation:proton antiporter [Candidatus Altiarchaeota archaeon]|nr:cation:proton antiporter [Candidatus Altiarchaeota archaeon]
MIGSEYTLLTLLSILTVGLVIPELFQKNRFPISIFLILFGAILGPNGIGLVQLDGTIEFFGFLGSMFLMLMAGMEVKFKTLRVFGKRISLMAAANGLIPFAVGFVITLMFGYSPMVALLVGIVFISSSVAIVGISMESLGLMKKQIGKSIMAATVIQDTASLILLSLLLQIIYQKTQLHPFTYLFVLIISIAAIKLLLPKLASRFLNKSKQESGIYERELMFVISVLLLASLYFSSIGVHSIVAAFIIGIILSDTITSKRIHDKLHTIGYGLFIPVFFFVVGMELDISLLVSLDYRNLFTFAIIIGLVLSKVLSGYISGISVKFSNRESLIFGVSSTVQLTTTLAVTYAVASAGLFDNVLTTSILLLSIFTTALSPIVLSWLSKDIS